MQPSVQVPRPVAGDRVPHAVDDREGFRGLRRIAFVAEGNSRVCQPPIAIVPGGRIEPRSSAATKVSGPALKVPVDTAPDVDR